MEVVKPEDTFEMEIAATGTKGALTNNEVPAEKNSRKVYGAILNNEHATEPAGVTFTIEEDTTVKRTMPEIVLPALTTLNLYRSLTSPIVTIQAERNIKAQVTTGTGPVNCSLQAYDL